MRNSRSFGLKLGVLGLALVAAPATASAADYYVDSVAGNDGGAGSMGAPWKTLAKAQGQSLTAGDRLLFARGSTFTGALDVTASGAANAPITLTSYGNGALPVFTNSDFGVMGGNSIVLHGSYVVIDALGFADGAAAPGYFDVGAVGAVHIHEGANHAVVKNSDFKNEPIGIRITGEDALITHNHIHDCTRALNGDVWGPLAIFLSNRGAEISFNRIENYAILGDASAFGSDGGAIEIDSQNTSEPNHPVNDTYVHHNVSIGNVGFMEVTPVVGGATNLRIAYNLSDDLMQGFLFHQAKNVMFENNTIRRVNTPITLKDGSTAEESVMGIGDVTGMTVTNNIFVVRADLPVYGGGAPNGTTHTHNLYFSSGTADPLGFTPGPTEIIGDPKFVDEATRNLHLMAGSPAIDAGVVLGYTQDLLGRAVPFGSAPDIGALEYQGPGAMTGPIGDPSGTGGASSGSGGASSGSGGAAQAGGAPSSAAGGAPSSSAGGTAAGSMGGNGTPGNPAAGGSGSVLPTPGKSGGASASGGTAAGQAPGSGAPASSREQVTSGGCGCEIPSGHGAPRSALLAAGLAFAASLVRRRSRA